MQNPCFSHLLLLSLQHSLTQQPRITDWNVQTIERTKIQEVINLITTHTFPCNGVEIRLSNIKEWEREIKNGGEKKIRGCNNPFQFSSFGRLPDSDIFKSGFRIIFGTVLSIVNCWNKRAAKGKVIALSCSSSLTRLLLLSLARKGDVTM